MKRTCVIIEDEPMARKLLKQYVEKITSLELLGTFSNPLEALDFLRNHTVDILFLDVQMPELTGVALLKIMPVRPVVVLTTAYSEYAIEGYELDVTDYLLKPITFERFLKAVEKATQRVAALQAVQQKNETLTPAVNEVAPITTSNHKEFLFVKDGTKLIKLWLKDIIFIEGLKDYVQIHTPKGKITTLQRLKQLEEELPAHQFFRVHHSYIIAIEWIDIIHRDKIEMHNHQVPISDTYRKAFKDFIDSRHIGK